MDNLFSSDFWMTLLSRLGSWTISELPGIIILVIALFVLLRAVNFSTGRLKRILVRRAEQDETVETAEAEKRINTLIGIIQGGVRIVLLTVFLIMLLSKFAIDVAPILASAGILGLAIGFGAQELVRDYISGFFM
ncbi:MAG: mechanosensitive ion channel family protein, partial [Marinilabiliaceae bacterium]